MAKKQTLWKTKGMNRDLSVSAFNPEFSFENKNLRLSTNEGNTLLSWVTEKGTEEVTHITVVDISDPEHGIDHNIINGIVIGTAIINKQLVFFTTQIGVVTSSPDYIYSITFVDSNSILCTRLFNGNLNFSADHPIETLVSYESEDIQKVYWVDGINQPRMINICSPQKGNRIMGVNTNFDFIPSFKKGNITAQKNQSGGLFAPGVIQYCFSYVNKNGQQSNIVAISPLYYLSYENRGASPEDKVSNSFTITIEKADLAFDSVRIYSIQRTSLDAVPLVKLLRTLDITENGTPPVANNIVYVDTGMDGIIMDSTELLYIGGKEILASTLSDKDNTLFLGDVTQKHSDVSILQNHFMSPANQIFGSGNGHFEAGPVVDVSHVPSSFYTYHSYLSKSNREITTFKGGERYRFGFQLKKHTGEWTDPVWIGDKTNETYPSISSNNVLLVKAAGTIDFPDLTGFDISDYVKIRPIVVYPSTAERKILCQGVLNPTVFNVQDRTSNSPYAQASWYFRPFTNNSPDDNPDTPGGPTVIINGIPQEGQLSADVLSNIFQNQGQSARDQFYDTSWYPNNDYFKQYRELADVLVARVDTSKTASLATITSALFNVNDTTTPSVTYDGIIDLGDLGDVTLSASETYIAFIRKAFAFPQIQYLKDQNSDPDYCIEYFRPSNYNLRPIPTRLFIIYSCLKRTSYNLGGSNFKHYYYEQPQGAPTPLADICYFCFYVDGSELDKSDLYQVDFSAAESAGGVIYNPVPTDQNPLREGCALEYHHYYSLADAASANSENTIKKVEIQGSKNTYNSWYDHTKHTTNSNTQFFVDQHIVTLNSPDIEFDETVQTASMEGLGLRVVGYIPITSSVSAHHITTSTNKAIDGTSVGRGELDVNVRNWSTPGLRLVAEYLWSDALIDSSSTKEETKSLGIYNFIVHPWNRHGSLNNDFRSNDVATSVLNTKKESNELFSSNSRYVGTKSTCNVVADIHLTENQHLINYKLGSHNYYPNIDKVLYNGDGYRVKISDHQNSYSEVPAVTTPISMKYCSTSHIIMKLHESETNSVTTLTVLPNITNENTSHKPFWEPTASTKQQKWEALTSGYTPDSDYAYLWLGELYRTNSVDDTMFGGKTKDALESNIWYIAGDEIAFIDIEGFDYNHPSVTLEWTAGDTYYQRYDCLKTFPFTLEDTNQLVEILSFMCETHVNLDGRYDRNRGLMDNTNMHPLKNFNLLNPVYSQKDSYFSQKAVNYAEVTPDQYPNLVLYTKTKTAGADVDLWTNIGLLGSVLDLDGDKGKINKLVRFNDQILAFQDTGFSQILYNENMQISTTEGVPIEIANSGKVNGKRYISNTIGCSNKWSLVNTPSGIYFIDNHDKNIYVFDGQLHNLSVEKGFNSWCKQNIPNAGTPWTPWYEDGYSTKGFDDFVTYYDKMNKDVLFINKDTALAYSEKIGTFTSFYDYGGIPYFVMLDGKGIWLTSGKIDDPDDSTPPISKIWSTVPHLHQTGSYCQFFGTNRPYWMTLVGNPEPQIDKIFTNIEFRACVDGDGTENTQFNPYLPFDHLESWDEYQHGIANLATRRGHNAFVHHTTDMNASLKRKFRMWRCDIPRDNVTVPVLPAEPTSEERAAYDAFMASETEKGIYRFRSHPLDRMRNPWVYLKLTKDAAGVSSTLPRAEIHDLMMTYFS